MEDLIYEAAVFPEKWPRVLDQLSTKVSAEGGVLANISDPTCPWSSSDGVRNLYDRFFAGGLAYNNARTKALRANRHNGFISDALYLGEKWMSQQEIYHDFLWRHGFGYSAGTTIRIPSGDIIAFSIEKKRQLGPVPQEDLDILDRYRPHLARAALVSSQLQFARLEAALQALQIANLPTAVIGDNGRVVDCNASFLGLSPQIVVQARDSLRFRDETANIYYRSVVERHRAWNRRRSAQGHSFPIPAGAGASPAIVHIVPIAGSAREIFLRTAFFVIVTPVEWNRASAAEMIQGIFDLTPAEAKVGASLARGESVQSTAVDFGVSVETVRSHVKSLLAKSGMERQTDFVATMASVPPIKPS
ncbi:hypothetical protein RDV64_02185 [Acuticoccus sp. MNP-M23]|uniref:helix-turn-helix transcriptional regulator n=1 Tax=Acuticoccus sp. MNP-M23 TaxID=3072793 RepID=UPI002815F6B1|nr:hypothetical protein [Acuticoccus sp. MNP-M23]WMS43232.1 hypothetical protein RDV64_02185 [Acuticoccus sp. MNP-M23]